VQRQEVAPYVTNRTNTHTAETETDIKMVRKSSEHWMGNTNNGKVKYIRASRL